MNTNNTKDTIYIDVDEDITGIIEKVRGSKDKIVALVLPKRATALQSIVNMKLLKRSAASAKKSLVLITSEVGLLPLAGAVGLHVAKTLESKPVIPEPPVVPDEIPETVGADEGEAEEVDKTKPVGELAGLPVAAAAIAAADDTIEVDNETNDEKAASGKAKKGKKNKKLKVPNFESFRSKLFLVIGGLLALLFVWILTTKVLPKAKITITTDSSNVDTSVAFTADAGAKSFDESAKVLPATQKTYTKTDSEKVSASGQKDLGTKAGGTITAVNCTDNAVNVPAGTLFTNSGKSFSTNQAVTVPGSNFTSAQVCKQDGKADVGVTATAVGDSYNLSGGRSFTSNFASTLTGASADGMSGGTSKIIKVVDQSDLDAAKQKMLDRNNDPGKAELAKQMKADNLFGINDTLKIDTPTVTSTPKVGDEGSDTTVNVTISYAMLGVKKDDLKKLVEDEVKKKIDTTKQTILSDGLDSAQTTITDKKSDTNVKATLQTTAEAGAQLDANAIKNAVKGKKRGDTQTTIQARPGIKDVKIEYSPFWIGATPSRTSRINVVFVQSNGQPSKQ